MIYAINNLQNETKWFEEKLNQLLKLEDKRLTCIEEDNQEGEAFLEKKETEELCNLIKDSEKLTLAVRNLGSQFFSDKSEPAFFEATISALDIKSEFTEQGWFLLQIPALLPKKKNIGKKVFLQEPILKSILRAKNDTFTRFEKCVICIVYCYAPSVQPRNYIDYDNAETSLALNCIKQSLLHDDSPFYCSLFQTYKITPETHTEIYVVPTELFTKWLKYNSKSKTLQEGSVYYEKN